MTRLLGLPRVAGTGQAPGGQWRPGKRGQGSGEDLLTAALGPEAAGKVPPEKRGIAQQILADYQRAYLSDPSLAIEDILADITPKLARFRDYRDPNIRVRFDALLLQTLRFLENRMDMTRQHAPRLDYLFEPAKGHPLPKEERLHTDYYEFLVGNLASSIKVEVSDVASGRVDVYINFGNLRFSAEVKRDEDGCSFPALRQKYLGQAAEYSNTNVRLGLLLVLDLTPKPHGAGDIRNKVAVESITTPGDSEPRGIVVVVVPGRRRTPSSVVAGP